MRPVFYGVGTSPSAAKRDAKQYMDDAASYEDLITVLISQKRYRDVKMGAVDASDIELSWREQASMLRPMRHTAARHLR